MKRYIVLLLLFAGVASPETSSLLPAEDMEFLREMTRAVLEASRVLPGVSVAGVGPNTSGATLVRPGGRNAYPAFWIRDYAMSLEAGMITPEEQRHALLLTASHQVDETITLPTGSVLPPGSIPDHISFGGVPIFFPGVLEEYEAQGGPKWGLYPSLDDPFFFIHMAAHYVKQCGDADLLATEVNGKSLVQRLEAAYHMPPYRSDSGIVFADEGQRGVNFGFFDTTVHTGDLFFCSLLKYRAARELAELLEGMHRPVDAEVYRAGALRLQQAFQPLFGLEGGYFRASTGKSAQPDVWGTAFAVYIGALNASDRVAACNALGESLRKGTIQWRGNIRQVPTDRDFSPDTAWEASYAALNRYQNGAYWGTPVGWVAYAVNQVDSASALALANDYIAELRAGDFRQGDDYGSPWECLHEAGGHRQNPVYLTSVACPLAAFDRGD